MSSVLATRATAEAGIFSWGPGVVHSRSGRPARVQLPRFRRRGTAGGQQTLLVTTL